MTLYNLDNSRTKDQLDEMMRLERERKCLFCPPNLDAGHEQRVKHRTDLWTVTLNRYPYAGTQLHLLLVPNEHVRDMVDLRPQTQADFWNVLAWVRDHYELTYYGFGVRNGSFQYTGSTIEHLHMHVMVGDVHDPDHTPVRFKFSSRPKGDLAQ